MSLSTAPQHAGLLDASWTLGMEKTRDLWYHGYDNYMRYDELAPLSCTGRGPDWHNPANIASNDVAGNFSVTLIDSLDTLVVLNDTKGFEKAVRDAIDWVSFDVNTKPQVFETTIRVLGGLLSAHQFANHTNQPFHIPWYQGQLLAMAHDLGERLLPAFKTPTSLPIARVNLRHGLLRGESLDTCTAGAGSLILEFGTLSRLTGDDRFEKAAHKAFFAIWNRRSELGLVGNTINAWTGSWLHPEITSIGAGIDSFYEYALKWYILSGDVEFLDVWQEAYASVMRYPRAPDGFWYRSANIHTGDMAYAMVDSLSAFWPGLQVLAGDIENAIKSHLVYWNLWKRFSGLPEIWDMNFRQATSLQYPLRPEFVESTWYLYRATRDPFYLDVGERILYNIIWRSKVQCGLAGINDLRTNGQDDRMESFVLSETLKYLYLLFDEDNPINLDDSNSILTTEGHLLSLDREYQRPISAIRRKLRGAEHLQCPSYLPPVVGGDSGENKHGLTVGIRSRPDIEYARQLIGAPADESEEMLWSADGWCEVPKVDLYTYDFILSPSGKVVAEDSHPTPDKLAMVHDGFILQNVSGIRTHIVSRLDGKGYDITKLGPFAVKTGQIVYVNDSHLFLAPVEGKSSINSQSRRARMPEVELRVAIDYVDPMFQLHQQPLLDGGIELLTSAHTALFGADPTLDHDMNGQPLRFGRGEGITLVRDIANPLGCQPYAQRFDDVALLVRRGSCTFLEKLVHAKAAGAAGVIVVSDEDRGVNASSDREILSTLTEPLDDVVLVVVGRLDGEAIIMMLDSVDTHGMGQVKVTVVPNTDTPAEPDNTRTSREGKPTANRVLYLNGHPLLNTRLLV
ncbi:alpha mannosidase-like protein [Panus rudis PR-1116 ss-1]|nr:alpha mannosidase-like protein [Panus rudis PR-1116 ss-1]